MNDPEPLNPFTPDRPVAPDLFAGRDEEIQQVTKALANTLHGRAQHVLVRGERWLGKTSIAHYVETMARNAESVFDGDGTFFTAFCGLGACRDLDEVCVAILDQMRNLQNSVKAQVMELLSKVSGIQVGMFGIQLSQERKEGSLTLAFPSLIEEIVNEAKASHDAFLIVLDETERAATFPNMASFLKNLTEQLFRDGYGNIMILMTATPDAIEALTGDHPSFPRLFRFVNLAPMTRAESDELFRKALARGEPILDINDEALEFAHHWSDGYPGILQEIGAAAFDADEDGLLTGDDMSEGLLGWEGYKGAIETLYDKHFARTLNRDLLSDVYRHILTAIAMVRDEYASNKDIEEWVTKNTRKAPVNIGPYLGQLVKRGILQKPEGERGRYRLSSKMLSLWLRLSYYEQRRPQHRAAART